MTNDSLFTIVRDFQIFINTFLWSYDTGQSDCLLLNYRFYFLCNILYGTRHLKTVKQPRFVQFGNEHKLLKD